MQERERLGNAPRQAEQLGRILDPVPIPQGLARNELTGVIGQMPEVPEVVRPRDSGMLDLREERELVLDALQLCRPRGPRVEQLEGEILLQVPVADEEDAAHAAASHVADVP